MPLPGGPADKFGNRYELWWTVSQLVRMLLDQVESIRIEDPGVTKAEFVVTSGGQRQFHQAKRSHRDGKWSLASLAATDTKVLQAMYTELAGNSTKFVFVSSTDASELRELTERARSAISAEEFEKQFLAAKDQKTNIEKLRSYWSDATLAGVYDCLRRIEIRTLDEHSLEDHVNRGLRILFLHDPEVVCAELTQIALDSVHKIITRDALVSRLAEHGCRLRRLRKPETHEGLITAFSESAAYQDDSFSILHMLEGSVHQLPGITCTVCEKFLDRFSGEATDISTSRAGDSPMVVKLIFRTYHQHQQDDWARRCLDLIDQMCLEGLRDAKNQLEEFER